MHFLRRQRNRSSNSNKTQNPPVTVIPSRSWATDIPGTKLHAAIAAANAHSALAEEPQLAPFIAEYAVKYGNMSVGTSRTELRRADIPGQWIIESRSNARE